MSNLFSLPFAQTAMGTLGAMLVTLGLKTLRGPTEHPSSPPQKPLADVHQQSVTPPEYAWKWGVLSGKCPQRELSERPASLGREVLDPEALASEPDSLPSSQPPKGTLGGAALPHHRWPLFLFIPTQKLSVLNSQVAFSKPVRELSSPSAAERTTESRRLLQIPS